MIAWVAKTRQKVFEKVWVVMRRQRGYVNLHFCASHFSGSFSLPQILFDQRQKVSLFSIGTRYQSKTLKNVADTLILTKTK